MSCSDYLLNILYANVPATVDDEDEYQSLVTVILKLMFGNNENLGYALILLFNGLLTCHLIN